MMWVHLATGLTGGWTFLFLLRCLLRWWTEPLAITAHFSPKGGCTEAVVSELRAARREILMQAYSFSSKLIAEALVAAKARGVHVEILLDRSNEQEAYSELPLLVEQGLAPLLDAHHPIAHNKVIVIDRKTVITGSFNFTQQAELENAENLIVIKGHPTLAKLYSQQFAVHKSHCHPPQPQAAATDSAFQRLAA